MTEMIYDRDYEYVMSSKSIIESKVKKGVELTEEDIYTLNRGTVNYDTINRIEGKQAEIQEKLNEMGYYDNQITNKSWDVGDMFYKDDLQRIVKNNALLRKSFFVLKSTPKDAIARYHYSEFNALEKVLNDLEEVIDEACDMYKECGEAYSGEE